MEIYRSNQLPAIYTLIPWIRKSAAVRLTDCKEDLEYISLLKRVLRDEVCISCFDDGWNFILIAEINNEYIDLDGSTNSQISWSYYYWKIKDVVNYINGIQPVEAVSVDSIGITEQFLLEKRSEKSCLPILNEIKKIYKIEYANNAELESILELESRIQSKSKLKALMDSDNIFGNPKRKADIRDNQRMRILARDNRKCVLCGSSQENSALDVDHIIPKSLIEKLSLTPELLSAEFNLAALCQKCNRTKRDYLPVNIITTFISLATNQTHPNHRLLPILIKLSHLQGKPFE